MQLWLLDQLGQSLGQSLGQHPNQGHAQGESHYIYVHDGLCNSSDNVF